MHSLVMLLIFLQWWAGPAWAQSDHGKPGADAEVRARDFDARRPFILTGCEFAVPVTSLTFAATACAGYVQDGDELAYSNQVAQGGTLPNVDGTHWILLFKDSFGVASGGWVALGFGTRYRSLQVTAQPVDPDGGVVVTRVMVAGGVIISTENFFAASNAQGQVFRFTDPVLGAVCDGITDDSAALQKANTFPSGTTIIFPARRCVIGATVTFTRKIHLFGQGQKSELFLTMGVALDGIVIDPGGPAGISIIEGTTWKDFVVVGAANSSRNCTVLRNIRFVRFVRLHFICGTAATGYALWLQDWTIQSEFDVTIAGSYIESPFGGVNYLVPTNGIKATAVGDTFGIYNHNTFTLDLTSLVVGLWVFADSTGGGNNDVRGIFQDIQNNAILIEGGRGSWIHDIHLEPGNVSDQNSLELRDHIYGRIGPRVTSASGAVATVDFLLTRADFARLDGITNGNIVQITDSEEVQIVDVSLQNFTTSGIRPDSQTVRTHFHHPAGTPGALFRESGPHNDGASFAVNGSAERWNTTTTAPPGDWSGVGGAVTWTREGTIVKHGLFSAHVSVVTTANQPAFTVIDAARTTLLAGQSMNISGWIYIPTAGGGDVTPQLWINGGAQTAGLSVITSRDQWSRFSASFLANVNSCSGPCTTFQVRFLPASGSIEFYLDAMSAVSSLTGGPQWFAPNPIEYASFDVSLTVDPASAAANSTVENTGLVLPGAAVNDFCQVGPPAAPSAGLSFSCHATAADTVTMRTHNTSTGAVDQASATFTLRVSRRP